MADEFLPVEYVCTGRAFFEEKLHVTLFKVENGGVNPNDPLLYKKSPTTSPLQVGARYLIPTKGTTLQATKYRYIGQWADSGDVANWRAKSDAEEILYMDFMRHKKAGKTNELLTLLLPLRQAYAENFQHARRGALELAVLRALRTAPTEDEIKRRATR